MTSLQEAWGWLQYADDTLRSAGDSYRTQNYAAAVSLAYFAAFRAAKSVIAFSGGSDPRTHKGVIVRFNELAVHRSDFLPQIAASLSQLLAQRRDTDYDFTYRHIWKAENTATEIEKSKAFVQEVQDWIGRHLPDSQKRS